MDPPIAIFGIPTNLKSDSKAQNICPSGVKCSQLNRGNQVGFKESATKYFVDESKASFRPTSYDILSDLNFDFPLFIELDKFQFVRLIENTPARHFQSS